MIERLYRDEYGRLLAGLIRLVRDVQLAEDVLQEAFAVAVEQWPGAVPEAAALDDLLARQLPSDAASDA